MKKIFFKTKAGFTIIEIMVSISLFLVIVMFGMTSLLNANSLSQKSRDMRSIIDNLNFIMEDMSRNLRTGYSYHCIDDGDTINTATPHNCSSGGKGVAFVSSSPVGNWAYYIDLNNGISKIVNGETTSLTPENISFDTTSSFIVTGAETGDGKQPFVTIKLSGSITHNKVSSPFSLQTSVSQRLLDNR